MNLTTNRIPQYVNRTRHERASDPLEFQRRFLAGLAVQKRVSQGKRKLSLVTNTQRPMAQKEAVK